MGRYTKPLDLYRAQKARFEKDKKTLLEGHHQLGSLGLADALELTSGGLSKSKTRGAFARGSSAATSSAAGRRRVLSPRQIKNRGLQGGVPLLPINIQSSKLHDSFRLEKGTGGTQTYNLTQDDPGGGIYRILAGGTRKMVDSGFFPALRNRFRPRNKAFIDHFSEQQRKSS